SKWTTCRAQNSQNKKRYKQPVQEIQAASERATQHLSFGDSLTIKTHRGSRISKQSLLIDSIATGDTDAIAAIDQAILRVVNVAQSLLEISPVEPFNLLRRFS